MKKTILLFAVLAFFTFKNQAQTVTDIDGNVYHTKIIGTQEWMVENLKVTKYSNGNAIPHLTDNTAWGKTLDGARCYYNNDSNTNALVYGALYNWYAVNDSRNIAPTGWHVPTDADWTALSTYLGGTNVAGGKLKEAEYNHWQSPNKGATNENGFTALPGGHRSINGLFEFIGTSGYWWSSTEYGTSTATSRFMFYNHSYLTSFTSADPDGFSVRCVKNSSTQINEINYQEEIKIYPNPAIDKIYIGCTEKQAVKIQVYNMIGECVLLRELNSRTNEINISSLTKGIYVIQIIAADWTVQRKLTKE